MMRRAFLRITVLVCCFCFVTLAGCVRTEPSKFYRLNAVSSSGTEAQTTDSGQELAIGVGPVKLPQYLDRPHIVTRTSTNELDSSGFDRWSEPLKNNITGVIAENLSMLLSTARITVFPWIGSTEIDYQVVVQVISFEGAAGGKVSLGAQWVIIGVSDKKELLTKKSSFSGSSRGEGYEALVAAQSQLLGDLSAEIAAAIQGLSQERPKQ
jgi:uncharacterized lipoprotein YmbA